MFDKKYYKEGIGLSGAAIGSAEQMLNLVEKYRKYGSNELQVLLTFADCLASYAKDLLDLTEEDRRLVYWEAYVKLYRDRNPWGGKLVGENWEYMPEYINEPDTD